MVAERVGTAGDCQEEALTEGLKIFIELWDVKGIAGFSWRSACGDGGEAGLL